MRENEEGARDQLRALSDVLSVMRRAPSGDIAPVLDTIAQAAARFCGAEDALILLREGDNLRTAAHAGSVGVTREAIREIDRAWAAGRAVLETRTVEIADIQQESDAEYAVGKAISQAIGIRAVVATPLLSAEGGAVGAIVLRRTEPRPFTQRQVKLLQSFADQAVIAIENVRLFTETKEALERQTAVSEILRVMAGSPTDVQPVLDAIADSAARFCGAENASVILQREDGLLHPSAHVGPLGSGVPPFPLSRDTVTGRSMLEGRPMHVDDLQAERVEYPLGSEQARAMGHRSTLAAPLMRGGRAFGAILLRRAELRPFTEKQIDLVRTFADQAVIAIENVRLFNETKEALEQQTAVGDVLATISRSAFDLPAVLHTIAERAVVLANADAALIFRVEGPELVLVARHPAEASYVEEFLRIGGRQPADGPTLPARAVRTLSSHYVEDVRLDPSLPQSATRTRFAVPIQRDGHALGVIVVTHVEVAPFTERQRALVETFADQAAIAIENVRLFNETKEALEQQTATAEVLKTISRSVFDLGKVLETVVENAARLTTADVAWIAHLDGDVLRAGARYGRTPEILEQFTRNAPGPVGAPMKIRPKRSPIRTATEDARTIRIDDATSEDWDAPAITAAGARSAVFVPLIRDGRSIGALAVARQVVRPFSEREVEIIQTFADQAAIAMENVRLFNETKEALEQQTATSEVLQSISRSAFDLQSVLDTVVERAAQLCGAEQAWLRRIEGDDFRFSAYYGASSELRAMFDELRLDGAMAKIDRSGMGGRAIVERRPIHVHDIAEDETLREASLAKRGGGRTALAVPLLRDGEPMGAIVVARNRVSPFTEREIRLVETFADQAVIAIENVRLFSEIQDKSRQLEIAGRHKSEFLANMSHELRTPLNAIIGFSEVLLQGMFGDLNEKQREYQQDVLSSGRHLLSLINDILDLSKIEAGHVELELSEFSLPAALHNGATMVRERASRHGIRVTVETDGLDLIVADERKVKQIVANLLSNAVKFTPDGGRVDVRAVRDQGEVRIAVHDTGIGIDEADRERIFLEFQQANRDPERSREGTGLGLALSKRYVELHGGRIWLESEVGRGSTFTFALPLVPTGKED